MKNLLLAAAVVLSAFQARAQYMHDYQSIIATPQVAQPNQTLIRTSDGGYFLITRLYIPNSQAAIMCYKLKSDMSVDWQRSFYFPTNASASVITVNDVKQTGDNGYIACGSMNEEGVINGAFLMRFDASANFMWLNIYPGVNAFNSVVETGKGGFMAAGGGGVNSSSGSTLLCTDAAGVPVWSKLISGTKIFPGGNNYGDNVLSEVIRTGKNQYAVVGSTNIFAGISLVYDADALVMTFDETGNVLGNWTYGNTWYGLGYTQLEYGLGIRYDKTRNNFFVLGEVESGSDLTCDGTLFRDAWVFSIDGSTGSVKWSNRYNILNNSEGNAERYPFLNSMDIGDKQIGFTGFTRDILNTNFHSDAFLTRIDYSGNVIGHRMYVDAENQFLYKVMRTPNNSFAAGGNTYAMGTGERQTWLLDSYDNIIEDCRMERPKLPQEKFPVKVISSVANDGRVAVHPLQLADYKYAYNEIPLCDRVLQSDQSDYKPTMRTVKGGVTALDGRLIAGRQWLISSGEGAVQLNVINSLGQQIMVKFGLQHASQVDLSALPSGIYIVHMQDQFTTIVRKIVLP